MHISDFPMSPPSRLGQLLFALGTSDLLFADVASQCLLTTLTFVCNLHFCETNNPECGHIIYIYIYNGIYGLHILISLCAPQSQLNPCRFMLLSMTNLELINISLKLCTSSSKYPTHSMQTGPGVLLICRMAVVIAYSPTRRTTKDFILPP